MKELTIVEDRRYLDTQGKPWPEGGERVVFKIRRLKIGQISPTLDRFNKVVGEITLVGGCFYDLPNGKLYATHEEASVALRKMS